jgi:hypothetical protein
MFMHGGVLQGVLFLQSFVVTFVRVPVTCFVVRPSNFSKPALQRGSPAALTLMTVVQPDNADEDRALSKVGAESAPERIPLA